MAPASDEPMEQADTALFGERLLRIIDEGRRVATYKLALLLALLDACATESGPTGAAPLSLHTRAVAVHVLRLYLPQSTDFVVGKQSVVLRQITTPKSQMLSMIAELHRTGDVTGCRTLDDIRTKHPEAYRSTLDEVERTFARYPIRLLQVVNGQGLPFLYDIDWDERVSLRSLHRDGGGLIRFRPGASDALLRLGPLMRPLIETHWTRMVAAINRIDLEEERLRAHLFGTSRRAFPHALRRDLAELHEGRCFYCDRLLRHRFDLDHLIPWSRFPNDAIENLVPADPRCNNAKSDTLPAIPHVSRWAKQIEASRSDLREMAQQSRWLTDSPHTLAIARSTYRHLATGTPLWLERGRVELFDGSSTVPWL
jgi:hypothetical protein